MENTKKRTNKSIYWILLVLSILTGIVFYGVLQGQFSLQFLLFFSGVPFFLFVIGSFGLLWPKLKPAGDVVYISHALLIGILFILLFFIHIWIILPRICPDFGSCLGVWIGWIFLRFKTYFFLPIVNNTACGLLSSVTQ